MSEERLEKIRKAIQYRKDSDPDKLYDSWDEPEYLIELLAQKDARIKELEAQVDHSTKTCELQKVEIELKNEDLQSKLKVCVEAFEEILSIRNYLDISTTATEALEKVRV